MLVTKTPKTQKTQKTQAHTPQIELTTIKYKQNTRTSSPQTTNILKLQIIPGHTNQRQLISLHL